MAGQESILSIRNGTVQKMGPAEIFRLISVNIGRLLANNVTIMLIVVCMKQ